MKITIDIDESLVPEGYEVVSYRVPRNGEYYITGIPNYDRHGLCKSDGDQEVANLILKKKRWRAKHHGLYDFIDQFGNVSCTEDYYDESDNKRYESGNYYDPDSGDSEKAAKRVRAAYVGEIVNDQ